LSESILQNRDQTKPDDLFGQCQVVESFLFGFGFFELGTSNGESVLVISEGTLGFPSGIEPLFVILEKEKR
jgi:hypothetical protein